METVCDPRSQRLCYKSTEKLLKMTKLKNSIMKRTKTETKSNILSSNTSGSQLGLPVNKATTSRPHKITNTERSQNFKQFYDITHLKALYL